MNDLEKEVASLVEKKEEQDNSRVTAARNIAHLLSDCHLGERLRIGDDEEVMAVPGGWIFYKTHKAGITSTFVPQPQGKPQKSTAPKIVLPN